MGVEIELVRHVDDDLVRAFGRLPPQLSPLRPAGRGHPAGAGRVARQPGDGGPGRRGDPGTLTLVLFPIPTGFRLRHSKVYRVTG